MTKNFQEKYSYTNIQEHKNNVRKMLFYLFYIILFLTVVLMQLRKTTSFSHKSSEEILENIELPFTKTQNLTFPSISSTKEMIFWLDNVVIPDLIPQQKIVSPNNYIFGSKIMVISLAILSSHSNSYSSTSQVFPNYTFSSYSSSSIPQSVLQTTSPSTHTTYVEVGEEGAPGFLGGFVWEIGTEEIEEKWKDVKEVVGREKTWGRMIVELLHYNRNSDMLIKQEIVFLRLPSGQIRPDINSSVVRYFYSEPLDIFRGVLELLFVVMASIYFTRTMRRWYLKGKVYMQKVFSRQSAELKTNNV